MGLYYGNHGVPGKRPLLGKCPCTSFQGVNVAQTYENYVPGKRPCGPKLQCVFKRPWPRTLYKYIKIMKLKDKQDSICIQMPNMTLNVWNFPLEQKLIKNFICQSNDKCNGKSSQSHPPFCNCTFIIFSIIFFSSMTHVLDTISMSSLISAWNFHAQYTCIWWERVPVFLWWHKWSWETS